MTKKRVIFYSSLLALCSILISAAPLYCRAPELPTVQTGVLHFAGLPRTYRIYVPDSYYTMWNVPLVIVLHGDGGDGERIEQITKLSEKADESSFIVVYPDGLEGHWNDGRRVTEFRAQRENIDDVGFITALIDRLAGEYNIDSKKIYLTGASAGALMTHRMGCERADMFAAIAPVLGGMATAVAGVCSPSRPVPILMINGTQDNAVPWQGDGPLLTGHGKFVGIMSVPDTVSFWVESNECRSEATRGMEPDKDPTDVTRVRKSVYSECRDDADVVMYEVQGGGHSWPIGTKNRSGIIFGKTSGDIDANEVIWDFFENHSQ